MRTKRERKAGRQTWVVPRAIDDFSAILLLMCTLRTDSRPQEGGGRARFESSAEARLRRASLGRRGERSLRGRVRISSLPFPASITGNDSFTFGTLGEDFSGTQGSSGFFSVATNRQRNQGTWSCARTTLEPARSTVEGEGRIIIELGGHLSGKFPSVWCRKL